MKKSMPTFICELFIFFVLFSNIFPVYAMRSCFFEDENVKDSLEVIRVESNKQNGEIVITFGNKKEVPSVAINIDSDSSVESNESEFIPIDVVKDKMFQFFDSETLKKMRQINRATKEAIDDFILKKDLSRRIDPQLAVSLLQDVRQKFDGNKASDSFSLLYKYKENNKPVIIFLNKNNFAQKCSGLLKKLLQRDYLFLQKTKSRIFFSSNAIFFILFWLLSIQVCESYSFFPALILTSCINLPLGMYVDNKIDNFRDRILEKDKEKFDREKGELEQIFGVPDSQSTGAQELDSQN